MPTAAEKPHIGAGGVSLVLQNSSSHKHFFCSTLLGQVPDSKLFSQAHWAAMRAAAQMAPTKNDAPNARGDSLACSHELGVAVVRFGGFAWRC